jgi:hypothetical protein
VSDGSRSGRWTRSPTTNTAACCAAGCSTSATPWTPTRPKHCPPLPNSGGRPRNSYWRRSRADAMRQCPPSDPTRDIPAMRRVRRRLGVVNPRLRRLPPHRTVRGTPWRLRVPCRSPCRCPCRFPRLIATRSPPVGRQIRGGGRAAHIESGVAFAGTPHGSGPMSCRQDLIGPLGARVVRSRL